MAGFRFGDGTVLEIYGPADDFHSFFTTGPVVGFRVGDFDATRAWLGGVHLDGACASSPGTGTSSQAGGASADAAQGAG